MHIKTLGSAAGVGVVLTGGGLDQVLGLLHLREPQYREGREAGWDIAEDGWEFTLRQTKALAF